MTNSFRTFSRRNPGHELVQHASASDPARVAVVASYLARQADLHLSEGRGAQADRLAHLALELRCWVQGGRT